MESTVLGLVLDSGVLIAAERRKTERIRLSNRFKKSVGEVPVVFCALTIAKIGHGIYRANTPEIRQRRRAFLDDLKATVPIHPMTEVTAEIVARIGGEEACKGFNLSLGDLVIGACALELGYAVGHEQPARFCPHSRADGDSAVVCERPLGQRPPFPDIQIGLLRRGRSRQGHAVFAWRSLALVSEILALIPRGSTATIDEDFAADLEAAIASHREPLNGSQWD